LLQAVNPVEVTAITKANIRQINDFTVFVIFISILLQNEDI